MKITIEYGAVSEGRIVRLFPTAYALPNGSIAIVNLDRTDSIRIADVPSGELVISENCAANTSIAEIVPFHSVTYNFPNS